MRLRATFISLAFTLPFLACSDDKPADGSSSNETGDGDGDGDGDPGDGDGDTGDGDGDTGDGDGDGDGDADCGPLDPPPAQTTEGTWADLPAPTPGFACNMAEGDGPAWTEGLTVTQNGSVDFLDIGNDGKLYAAGADADGALVAGIRLGQGPNGAELWARSWTYNGEVWPARGLAATPSGNVWITAAPEHILAASEAGDMALGPIELFEPGMRYVGTIGNGDNVLLLTAVERATPPTCIERVRLQSYAHATADYIGVSPAIVSTTVMGIDGDRSGGSWMTVLDLNGAGLTSNHYGADGAMLGMFPATNQAANVMVADMAVAGNGDIVITIRSLGFIEVHRYSPDGTKLWGVDLPAFGAQHGEPRVDIDGQDAAVVAVTVGSSYMLARVLTNGTIDFAGRWNCGDPVEVRDVAAAGNAEIWVGGVQGSTGWVAAY